MKDLSCVPEEYQRQEWVNCTIPYRPWWSGSYLQIRRSDAKTNPALPPGEDCGYGDVNLGPGVVVIKPATFDARLNQAIRDASCVEYDNANPIPFPGFRVGQIWGMLIGDEFVVSDPLTKVLIKGAKPNIRYRFREWKTQGVTMTGHEAIEDEPNYHVLFSCYRMAPSEYNACPVFLLHDPLRPSAVPWSGYFPLTDLEGVFR